MITSFDIPTSGAGQSMGMEHLTSCSKLLREQEGSGLGVRSGAWTWNSWMTMISYRSVYSRHNSSKLDEDLLRRYHGNLHSLEKNTSGPGMSFGIWKSLKGRNS